MFRNYIAAVLFFALSVLFWSAGNFFNVNLYYKISLSFLLAGAVFAGYEIITGRIAKRVIKSRRTQYTFNKGIFILSALVFLIFITQIWIENTESLVISYGIIAAGIAIALQDLFRNFVGGIIIAVSGVYRVGDRVRVKDSLGDIMDIGIMNTTMMEAGGFNDSEQPTGRLITMPNSVVISETVYNYTRDHSFIWDEIKVSLTCESDWKKAAENFLNIVTEETGSLTKQAENEIEILGEKYYLPKKMVEPAVYIRLAESRVELGIRYVTDSRDRRIISDALNRKILEDIKESGDYILA
ncbi:small-conductance mechanosensitive channel [Methanomicrobium sp. W14]|uniref:mechanosensitive ion channel domain-containing protein n=1 Tax=Methanomicrobium sp. W14 TaxID=2817839 RepID=UPI001AE2EB09|nr:mechanosensitive ion channel domain-containing protein [Methanomicrobium sp. W14]MBP2132361.1 small-conductance mechanosensitive channel [Methanomicrobium sp. W14]